MALRFYNTLTKTKEEFTPLVAGEVRVYNCGPTVYDYAHIGNFRSFTFADLLRRWLEYRGLRVRQVMNLTDVGHMVADADAGEDKLEKRARERKQDPWALAEMYIRAFLEDARALRFQSAEIYPRATDHIPEMISMIETLVRKGIAYEVKGAVYFDVRKFPGYGRLSGNTLDQLHAGARIEPHPDKRHPADFALWKQDAAHLMQWDSPWGRGFPGWHIECSAMSMKYLGPTFDIHTGGEDNIFPHHEAERAQSEAATGEPFVRTWMHARHLFVNGEKMSKSLGNFFTFRDLAQKGFGGVEVRYLLLSTHYRQSCNFTLEGLEGAKKSVHRLREFDQNLAKATGAGRNPEIARTIEGARRRFEEALDDDLNMAPALAAVFDLVRDVNRLSPSAEDAADARAFLHRVDVVLGVLDAEAGAEELPDAARDLIRQREEARAGRDFARADTLRKALLEVGIEIKDTKDGPEWRQTGQTRWRRHGG